MRRSFCRGMYLLLLWVKLFLVDENLARAARAHLNHEQNKH